MERTKRVIRHPLHGSKGNQQKIETRSTDNVRGLISQ